MSKELYVNESGRTIRVSSDGFDMSDYTDLWLTFTKPDREKVTKTYLGGEVFLGTVDVVDLDLGQLYANQYVEYFLEPTLLDQYGEPWYICLSYYDDTTIPTTRYEGTAESFSVKKKC